MYAEGKARKAHQQRQNDAQHHQELFLGVFADGGIQRYGIGGVSAGEGVPLRRNVVDIGAFVNSLQAFDPFIIKIRSSANKDVFDQGIQRDADQHIQTDMLAELLVPAPV